MPRSEITSRFVESRFKAKHSLDSDEEDDVKAVEKEGLGDEDLAAQEESTIVSTANFTFILRSGACSGRKSLCTSSNCMYQYMLLLFLASQGEFMHVCVCLCVCVEFWRRNGKL